MGDAQLGAAKEVVVGGLKVKGWSDIGGFGGCLTVISVFFKSSSSVVL